MSDGSDLQAPPEEPAPKHKVWFALAPETITESAERLAASDDHYAQYLASELIMAYDTATVDLSCYRGVEHIGHSDTGIDHGGDAVDVQ